MIATRKPRHPTPIPTALRVNAILVRSIAEYDTYTTVSDEPKWMAWAKERGITAYNLLQKINIVRWHMGLAYISWPDIIPGDYAPPAPELQISINPSNGAQQVTAGEFADYHFMWLFREDSPDNPYADTSLVGYASNFGFRVEHEEPYNLHGTYFYRAIAHYSDYTPSPISDALEVTWP
jgi:hypothetical protein